MLLTLVSVAAGQTREQEQWARQTHEEQQRATLKGLKRIGVVVEDSLSDEARKYGLDESKLRTDAELRVRKSGIHVLPIDQLDSETGRPFLYILVRAEPVEGFSGLFIYTINVNLQQHVALVRNPTILAGAPTWRANRLGTVGRDNLGQIRGTTNDLIDEFVNAYLAANQ